MNKLEAVTLSILIFLHALSILGVIRFFQWLFSVELLTTAGFVGLFLVIPIMLGEIILTIFVVGCIGYILHW